MELSNLSTKTLVALYNKLTDKEIKKFSSRAAGEKQIAAIKKMITVEEWVEALLAVGAVADEDISPEAEKELVEALDKEEPKTVSACLGCGAEFGLELKMSSNTEHSRSPSKTQGESMKATMRLDRRIECVTDQSIWNNAFQMWKANPSWMTSAQQDSLTAKLYSAAKLGNQITVTINGRSFQLVSVG